MDKGQIRCTPGVKRQVRTDVQDGAHPLPDAVVVGPGVLSDCLKFDHPQQIIRLSRGTVQEKEPR